MLCLPLQASLNESILTPVVSMVFEVLGIEGSVGSDIDFGEKIWKKFLFLSDSCLERKNFFKKIWTFLFSAPSAFFKIFPISPQFFRSPFPRREKKFPNVRRFAAQEAGVDLFY